MRTFLCGVPSSGATFVAWTMSQSPGTLGLLDMCIGEIPRDSDFPSRLDVVIKDTVGSGRPHEEWLARFKPDRVVIITRNEARTRESMIRRYNASANPGRFLRHGEATIDAIYQEFHRVVGLNQHDEIVRYEDIVASKPELPRSLMEIAVQNHLNCEWCRWNAQPARWGFGGIHLHKMTKTEVVLLFRTIRYYGTALLGYCKWRHKFIVSGMYVPPLLEENDGI